MHDDAREARTQRAGHDAAVLVLRRIVQVVAGVVIALVAVFAVRLIVAGRSTEAVVAGLASLPLATVPLWIVYGLRSRSPRAHRWLLRMSLGGTVFTIPACLMALPAARVSDVALLASCVVAVCTVPAWAYVYWLASRPELARWVRGRTREDDR